MVKPNRDKYVKERERIMQVLQVLKNVQFSYKGLYYFQEINDLETALIDIVNWKRADKDSLTNSLKLVDSLPGEINLTTLVQWKQNPF